MQLENRIRDHFRKSAYVVCLNITLSMPWGFEQVLRVAIPVLRHKFRLIALGAEFKLSFLKPTEKLFMLS